MEGHMEYEVEFFIADPNSKCDNLREHRKEIPYNDRNLQDVLQKLEDSLEKEMAELESEAPQQDNTRKRNRLVNEMAMLDYMRAAMPCEEEIRDMLDDIKKYYVSEFDLNTGEKKVQITVVFFFHRSFQKLSGDAEGQYIRIGCKNIVKNINNYIRAEASWIKGGFAQRLEEGIEPSEREDCFRNRLRKIVAHEFFHAVHDAHLTMAAEQRYGSEYNRYRRILMEVFAEHFAYSYMLEHYLRGKYEKGTKAYSKKVFWSAPVPSGDKTNCFGKGRKQILEKHFEAEEIAKDNEYYENLKKDGRLRHYADPGSYGVSDAEYDGGYILYRIEEKQDAGKHGKKSERYTTLYQKDLAGKSDEALADLIKMKEQLY